MKNSKHDRKQAVAEPEEPQATAAVEQGPEVAEPVAGAAEDLSGRLAELTDENNRLRDQMLRLRAEFENFRRRSRRELEEFSALANESLIQDLLPVLDDLSLLVHNAEEKHEIASLLDGARLIQQKFADILKRRGLEEVEAEGKPFDPEHHEALLQTPSAEVEPGTIIDVHQTGYRLGGKLLRPSRVIVASEPERKD